MMSSILIVGLGKTGLSVARFLARQGMGFVVADSRMTPPGLTEFHNEFPGHELRLGAFDAAWFASFTTLVVSPGIAVAEPAIVAAARAGAIRPTISAIARRLRAS